MLVNRIGAHGVVGTDELADLQNLIRKSYGHEIDENIAEERKVFHQNNERERDYGFRRRAFLYG